MRLDPQTVENALLTWELALGGGRQVVTAELVGLWQAILDDEQVTAKEFDRAALMVIKGAKFMPRPAEVLDVVKEIRRDQKALAARQQIESLVVVTDANGNHVALPASQAKELPAGPSALPMPARSKAAIVASMKPGAARLLIDFLRSGGAAVIEEQIAIEEALAAKAKQDEEDAERREIEQLARLQAQAMTLRQNRE